VTYDGAADVSWILLLKPSLTGGLTEDIQWESYRALGQQIARRVLG
jgi:hypothetical protein